MATLLFLTLLGFFCGSVAERVLAADAGSSSRFFFLTSDGDRKKSSAIISFAGFTFMAVPGRDFFFADFMDGWLRRRKFCLALS